MKDIEHNPYEITSDMVKAALIKLEQVSKMVQNMSKDDLNNLVSMLNKNNKNN